MEILVVTKNDNSENLEHFLQFLEPWDVDLALFTGDNQNTHY